MKILLTRPHKDSQATADILQTKNMSSAIQPMFEIIEHDVVISDDDYQAIIFTSRHSVTSFARQSDQRNIPVYCVGNHTAQCAADHHFETVFSADGDATDLSALIQKNLSLKNGKILRLTGYPDSDFLSAELQIIGYEIDIVQLYHPEPVATLSDITIDLLNRGKLDGVLFFSPQTAAHFYTLLTDSNLAQTCRTLKAWCISDKTALALNDLPFNEIHIASRPTHNALIDLIST